jgi:hypothetical protein
MGISAGYHARCLNPPPQPSMNAGGRISLLISCLFLVDLAIQNSNLFAVVERGNHNDVCSDIEKWKR